MLWLERDEPVATLTSGGSQHQSFCKQEDCQWQNLMLSPYCCYLCNWLFTWFPFQLITISWNSILQGSVHSSVQSTPQSVSFANSHTPTPGRWVWLASFPGSGAGEEEREPGTHCSCMRQVPMVTCILLHCAKIAVNPVYLLKGHTADLYFLWDIFRRFWSQKLYSFDGNSLHCFIRGDWWKIASVTHRSVYLEWTNAWRK